MQGSKLRPSACDPAEYGWTIDRKCATVEVMAIDGGVVVAYLTAYVLRGGRRVADHALESLMNRLVDRVSNTLGDRPLNTLKRDQGGERSQRLVASKISEAMRADPSFARELRQLVAELDSHGGRLFINQIQAETSVVHSGTGHAIGGDVYYAPPPPSQGITPDSSAWVKVLAMLGALMCIGAFGLFGYTLFTDDRPPGDTSTPDGVVQAGAVFFAGLVVMALAGFANMFTKRPPPPF